MSSDAVTVSPSTSPTTADRSVQRRLAHEMFLTGAQPPVESCISAGNVSPMVVNNTYAVATTWTYRVRLVFPNGGAAPRFWFSTLRQSSGYSTHLGDSVDLKAAIELAAADGSPSGTILPLYFNGARTRTVTITDPVVASDPIGIVFEPGAVVYVRSRISNPGVSAVGLPAGTIGQVSNNEGYATTDVVDGGAIINNHFFIYGPCFVTGQVSAGLANAVAIFGTSIEQIYGDKGNVSGATGYLQRAFGISRPYGNFAIGSSQYQFFNTYTNGHEVMTRFMRFFRDGVFQYATNDIAGGANLATLQTRHAATVAKLRAAGLRRLGVTTTLPRSTSTDAWQTTGNQTADANETTRRSFNAWLATNSGADFVWDTAAVISNPTNPGIWRADGITYTNTTTAAGSTTTSVNLSTSYTLGQFNGFVTIVGANPASAILNHISATQIQLFTALGGAPSAGVAVSIFSPWTWDGIHPSARGHAEMATVCNLSDLD